MKQQDKRGKQTQKNSKLEPHLLLEIPAGTKRIAAKCPFFAKCGGCQLQELPYEAQLAWKQNVAENLLGGFGKLLPIIGMEEPWHYRNKVHSAVAIGASGQIISGIYEANSHKVVPITSCAIEDPLADELLAAVREAMRQCKIRPYDEDTKQGLVRHILIKRGFASGQSMVVLVTASAIFPGRNNFVTALRKMHPEITTIVMNVNPRKTSVVLGEQERILYGKGSIEDVLCGCTFRISPKSFYQVNPKQTQRLYQTAMEFAGLTGKEKVLDAYCGIGTIGLIASKNAKSVVGVELNRDAVQDAIQNAKRNHCSNIRFVHADAGAFLLTLAAEGEKIDVLFLDPPRTGSEEAFLGAVCRLKPKRVVYISCDPQTQKRDLHFLCQRGYGVTSMQAVDLFPQTRHIETVVLLSHKNS